MCLKWFIDKKDILKRHLICKKIKASMIDNILEELFGDKCVIMVVDRYKWATSLDNIKDFLEYDDTDELDYRSEKFDCDNFAFRLLGQFNVHEWSKIPIGIVFVQLPDGGYHAMNICIDEDLVVYIIEPQSDKIRKASDMLKEGYKAYFVLM